MKYKLTIWYQRLTWCVCELKQNVSCMWHTYITVHIMFSQTLRMIFTSTAVHLQVVHARPTTEAATMQELLNSTEQKVSGCEKGDEESIKKERGTNNSIYYSACVKLTLHQVKNVSNAQQLRKASLLSLLLHEKFTRITEVTTAQILLCWTKHDLYIAKEKRSRKLVHRKILYINKKDICI